MTLTVTMPLKEWLLLSKQQGGGWPSSALVNRISEMVAKASEHFTPAKEETK